jgi:hypothetical protein
MYSFVYALIHGLLVACCWLLVAGFWLLVVGCWLLVAGYWLLVTDYRLLITVCCLPFTDYRLLVSCSKFKVLLLPTATATATVFRLFSRRPDSNEELQSVRPHQASQSRVQNH